jgi:hypothetical protein
MSGTQADAANRAKAPQSEQRGIESDLLLVAAILFCHEQSRTWEIFRILIENSHRHADMSIILLLLLFLVKF